MAVSEFLDYGLYFPIAGEAATAQAANAGSLVLAKTPEAAVAFAAGLGLTAQVVTPSFPKLSTVPGFVDLGAFTPGGGTPGITWVPEFIPTDTLTTAVTQTLYNGIGGVVGTTATTFTWTGTILSGALTTTPTPPVGGLPALPTGTFTLALVSYTGDGSANRQIPTAIDLTQGVVAIWLCGQGADDLNVFRANHAAMLGTSIMGAGVGNPVTTSGIMGFGAFGFLVTDGTFIGEHYANRSGVNYTAVVMRDTTSDNRYLRTGRYVGDGSTPRVITTLGKATQITHVWIWGRSVAYSSTDFLGDAAVTLANEADPTTGMVSGFGNAAFTIGSNNNVNNTSSPYDYVALSVDVPLNAQNLFKSFTGTGTASPPLVLTMPFQPGLAMARQFTTGAGGGIWRGPDHTGTDSAWCAISVGSDVPTLGISAMGATSVSLQTLLAPNGIPVYGFAFKAGSLSLPPGVPTITIIPPATPGPVPPIIQPFINYPTNPTTGGVPTPCAGPSSSGTPVNPPPTYATAPYPVDPRC